MKLRFPRLSLLPKIILSTSVAITALFAITGDIVLRNIQQTTFDSLEQEVHASFQAYSSYWKSQTDFISSVSRVLSEMPEVRLAFFTEDRATIQDALGELWRKVSVANAIFVVTEPTGKVIMSLGGAIPSLPKVLEVVPRAAAAHPFPAQSSGFFSVQGDENCDLYYISITPVYVQGGKDQNVLTKVLVAGYHVDAVMAQQLREATGGSEFLFVTSAGSVSTLNPRATDAVTRKIAAGGRSGLVSDGVKQYAHYETPLLDVAGQKVGSLYILRSFEAARASIASLQNKILMLWLVAVSAGLLLTYLLARRIVEPVKQLDRAAAEVARQNYATEVHVKSGDELGRLAQTFNNMCASIREGREELIRQERIATIGRLSGSIVHDLRNPLAAIYGGSEMLVDADLPPAHVKRLAVNIYRASRRIQELLQDLVNVSRGKARAPEPCRLREIASAACDSWVTTADAQHVRMEVDIPPEIELPLERSRMERAFVNLIGNALEAMPEGGEVRISAELKDSFAVVHVEDTGPGIAPEIRSKLFQPFVSAGKRNGLGLGLALSRQTVLDHGGDMWVESTTGHGARFSFRLPGARIAQAQQVV